MKGRRHRANSNSQERFRLCFKKTLQEYLARDGSTAKGFGIAWEKTSEQVPLDETVQGALYRELLGWASDEELFTGPKQREVLGAWRETAYDF